MDGLTVSFFITGTIFFTLQIALFLMSAIGGFITGFKNTVERTQNEHN